MADYIPPEYSADLSRIRRQQAISQALLQSSFAPRGSEVVSGRVVRQSPLEHIARALTGGISAYNLNKTDQELGGVQQRIAEGRQRQLQDVMQNPESGLTSADPRAQQLAQTLIERQTKDNKPLIVSPNSAVYIPGQDTPAFVNKVEDTEKLSDIGRLLAEQRTAKPGSREWNLLEKRIERLNAPPAGMQITYGGLVPVLGPDDKPALAQPNNRGGADIVPGIKPMPPVKATGTEKPMPATVVKLQDELLGDISIATGLSTDLSSLTKQLEGGKLSFGPITNLVNKGLNLSGNSTEASRNAQSAQATLEKIRNDSLRLNKGTQTEGDAVRAWTENFPSLTDTKAVAQRMREIKTLNDRAANEKKQRITALRNEYSRNELDTSPVEVTQPAVGAGAQPRPLELNELSPAQRAALQKMLGQ